MGWQEAVATKVREGRGGYLGCKGAGHPGCRDGRRSFKDTPPHLVVIYDPLQACTDEAIQHRDDGTTAQVLPLSRSCHDFAA